MTYQPPSFADVNNTSLPVIRLAVVGDSGVGKTIMLRKLCYTKPPPTNFFDFGVNLELCYHLYQPPSDYFGNYGHYNGLESSMNNNNNHNNTTTTTTINNNNNSTPYHHDDLQHIPAAPPSTASSNANTSTTSNTHKHPELFLIQFLDLPGHKRYQETRASIFNDKIDGVILFFDARHTRSENSVPRWYHELTTLHQQRSCFTLTATNTPQPHQLAVFPIFLVGTVVSNLAPFNFSWIQTMPFSDLVFLDINTVEEYVDGGEEQNKNLRDFNLRAKRHHRKLTRTFMQENMLLDNNSNNNSIQDSDGSYLLRSVRAGLDDHDDDDNNDDRNHDNSSTTTTTTSSLQNTGGDRSQDDDDVDDDDDDDDSIYNTLSNLPSTQALNQNHTNNNNNNNNNNQSNHNNNSSSKTKPPRRNNYHDQQPEHPFLTFQSLLSQFIDNIITEKKKTNNSSQNISYGHYNTHLIPNNGAGDIGI